VYAAQRQPQALGEQGRRRTGRRSRSPPLRFRPLFLYLTRRRLDRNVSASVSVVK
jgi:hypothetical protein